jgi:hypothetical protein
LFFFGLPRPSGRGRRVAAARPEHVIDAKRILWPILLIALLTPYAYLAVWSKADAGKLFKRLRQGSVLISWLIEQALTIERIRRRTKRRRNLRAGVIQAGRGSCVIRRRLHSGASGKGGCRAHDGHSYHAVNLGRDG